MRSFDRSSARELDVLVVSAVYEYHCSLLCLPSVRKPVNRGPTRSFPKLRDMGNSRLSMPPYPPLCALDIWSMYGRSIGTHCTSRAPSSVLRKLVLREVGQAELVVANGN